MKRIILTGGGTAGHVTPVSYTHLSHWTRPPYATRYVLVPVSKKSV